MLLADEETPELAAELQRYLEDYYPAYEEGHLLEAGGLADQPARYTALIRALKRWDEQVDAKYLELNKTQTPG